MPEAKVIAQTILVISNGQICGICCLCKTWVPLGERVYYRAFWRAMCKHHEYMHEFEEELERLT